MSSWTTIVLDTTAPQITWGAPDGAVASETLTVPYLVDEPGITSAEIVLLDGRTLPMTVGAGALTVILPVDAPEGAATVRAYVLDDVGNAAVRQLVVAISGVLLDQQPPPVPGWPGHPGADLIETAPSRASLRSVYTVGRLASSPSRAAVRSRYSTVVGGLDIFAARGILTTNWSQAVRVATSETHAGLSEETAVLKRPEGPDAEDDLIILGLI